MARLSARRMLWACLALFAAHAGLSWLAQQSDGVAALLSPSPASAFLHLALGVSFLAVRVALLVLGPGLLVAALALWLSQVRLPSALRSRREERAAPSSSTGQPVRAARTCLPK